MQVHITDDVTKIYSPDYVGNGMPLVGNDVTCQWKLVAPPGKVGPDTAIRGVVVIKHMFPVSSCLLLMSMPLISIYFDNTTI